ncbi:MAG TPA: metallophosphoesterase [Isosphaeraceae bacterium]|nr:metallophosphoesterase [Isosphaeraceae bacterium]
MQDPIIPDGENEGLEHEKDGVDRRGFLKCMAWAGTGLIWTAAGGVFSSRVFGQEAGRKSAGGFSFVQISDSHIGFNKGTYKEVVTTLQETVAKINALPQRPDFLLHSGDLTHLSTAKEFDTVSEILKSAKVGTIFCVPGEHDIIGDGQEYMNRFGKGSKGDGWYSFDHHGVHFIGLVNVASQGTDKGLGILGKEQLDWLKADLAGRTSNTPVVVFAHVPLWSVYPQWGWGTEDGQQALSYLKPFGSVTVLNGHIHQTLQKVEGNVTFHTARSTAFPQPAPGKAPAPGPMKDVPAEKLRAMLGLTSVNYVVGRKPLAVVDSTLG